MNFDLRRPCPKCPFRTDCMEGWLSRGRAAEIAHSLTVEQAPFACHETTEATGSTGPERHCAGALLVLDRSGEPPGQLARIAERTGVFKPDELDTDAPVFDSLHAFIEHHDDERDQQGEPCSVVDGACEAPAGYATSGGAVEAVVAVGLTEECVECGGFVCNACSEDDGDGRRLCNFCKERTEEA